MRGARLATESSFPQLKPISISRDSSSLFVYDRRWSASLRTGTPASVVEIEGLSTSVSTTAAGVTSLNQRPAIDRAMIRFCSEIFGILQEVDREAYGLRGWKGSIPQVLLDLQPFSQLLRAYGNFLETSGTAEGDPLILGHLQRHDEIFRDRYRYLGEILLGYLSLPEDRRALALERSEELMAMRCYSGLEHHLIVWNSELPVIFLHSELYSNGSSSDYELAAFLNGHDSRIHKEFGIWAPMLLTASELSMALRMLQRIDPAASPRQLSKLAQFRQSEMTADILLELLRLGYSSPEQIRRAAEAQGFSNRSRVYLSSVISGGTDLTDPVRS